MCVCVHAMWVSGGEWVQVLRVGRAGGKFKIHTWPFSPSNSSGFVFGESLLIIFIFTSDPHPGRSCESAAGALEQPETELSLMKAAGRNGDCLLCCRVTEPCREESVERRRAARSSTTASSKRQRREPIFQDQRLGGTSRSLLINLPPWRSKSGRASAHDRPRLRWLDLLVID